MNDPQAESFGDLLREKIAELDAHEAPPLFVADDPVDRLGLDARRCLHLVPTEPVAHKVAHGYAEVTSARTGDPAPRRLNLVR